MTDPDKKFDETCQWEEKESRTARQDDTLGGEIAGPVRQHESIGRYRIERILGRGAFGCVYLADDTELKRRVAIKVPNSTVADPSSYLAEAQHVASLDHPNIVPVYDVGKTDDGHCYTVSKYVEGMNLAARMKERRFSLSQTANLVATVADALHYAHTHELVHRDVKPANILIDENEHVFVADFGLALSKRSFGTGPSRSGTPAYMSPEQARGESHLVDGRTDIFSLGVVFFELLTGERPFRGETEIELIDRIATIDAVPPRQINDSIPRELEQICLKALARRPVDRYTTARDLSDDLRRYLDDRETVYEAEPLVAAVPTPITGFFCPHCGTKSPPYVKRRTSLIGWAVVISFLFVCFLLSPIGLFIKEDYRLCSQCGQQLP